MAAERAVVWRRVRMKVGRFPSLWLRAIFHHYLVSDDPGFSFSWTLSPHVLKRNYN